MRGLLKPVIVGILSTGTHTPPNSISNEELVEAYNTFVKRWNAKNPDNPFEAVGMVNDHLVDCPRHQEIAAAHGA